MSRLFGGLLLGAGILIMTCSGLCSLVVFVIGFDEALRDPSVMVLPLVIGGIPFATGFAMLQGGRRLLRRHGNRET